MRPLPWPRSRRGWALYALAWLTFATGFAATSWIRDGGPSWQGLVNCMLVMLPAALLGIVVIAVCARVDLDTARSAGATVHLLGALLYPVVWVALVSGLGTVRRGLATGVWGSTLPPEHVLHWHFLTGVLIYVTLAAVSYGLERSLRAEQARQRAEWQLLRAQLNPHFLFNTLHSLFALSRLDAETGERGLDCFSRVLRYSLHVHRHDREWVPLSEEWEFSRDYLSLEELRFGERLRWESDFSEDALRCAIPPVLLQPLIENALRYAVHPRPEGARLMIRAGVHDGTLTVRVSDDGPGCEPADAARSRGVGLRSIRTRLETLVPHRGQLRIETAPDRGFSAIVTLLARPIGGPAHGPNARTAVGA